VHGVDRRLIQLMETEEFLRLKDRLNLLLAQPVWWHASGSDCPIRLIESHDKRECGLLHDDNRIREEWRSSAQGAIERVLAERTGVIANSPPGCVQAVIPVFCGREVQGVIGMAHLPEYEIQRLTPLLPLMVDHIRNIAERERANEDLKGVQRLWRDVVSTLDLEVLQRRILQEIVTVLDAGTGVLLLTDSQFRLIPRIAVGFEDQTALLEGFKIAAAPYENKISGWNHAAQILSSGDPLRKWFLGLASPADESVGVWAVPLKDGGRLLGLALCPGLEGSELEPHLDMTVETLMLGSSVAIRNAKEFEQMRQKAVALSTVHSVYRLMSTTREVGDLLDRMANLTIQVLNVRKCSIMLVDGKGWLQPRVKIGLEPGEIGTGPLQLNHGLPGRVAATAMSLMVDRPSSDPNFADDPAAFYPSQSYLSVPLFEEDVVGVITVADRIGNSARFAEGDREVLNTLAEQAVIALLNIQFFEKQERIALRTMETFENLYETGDPDKEGGAQRLADLVGGLARYLKIEGQTRQVFRMAAYIHHVSHLILSHRATPGSAGKPDPETPLQLSVRMARRLELPESVIPILRHRYENFDGSGVPRRLKGEEIPLGARLLSLANAFLDLLPEGQDPLGGPQVPTALSRVADEAGKRFDPNLVEALRGYFKSKQP